VASQSDGFLGLELVLKARDNRGDLLHSNIPTSPAPERETASGKRPVRRGKKGGNIFTLRETPGNKGADSAARQCMQCTCMRVHERPRAKIEPHSCR